MHVHKCIDAGVATRGGGYISTVVPLKTLNNPVTKHQSNAQREANQKLIPKVPADRKAQSTLNTISQLFSKTDHKRCIIYRFHTLIITLSLEPISRIVTGQQHQNPAASSQHHLPPEEQLPVSCLKTWVQDLKLQLLLNVHSSL